MRHIVRRGRVWPMHGRGECPRHEPAGPETSPPGEGQPSPRLARGSTPPGAQTADTEPLRFHVVLPSSATSPIDVNLGHRGAGASQMGGPGPGPSFQLPAIHPWAPGECRRALSEMTAGPRGARVR
jgi:hypothetical protein